MTKHTPLLTLHLLLTVIVAAQPDDRGSGTEHTALTELDPVSAHQSWGQPTQNLSVWGKPMQIGDRKFATGLGTHANSDLRYALEPGLERFEAWVGLDAAVAGRSGATAIFRVLVDGREQFNSGTMRADSPARRVSVPLAGATELRLIVSDAGDSIEADHANWAEAALLGKAAPHADPAPARVSTNVLRTSGLEIGISDHGEIVGALLGLGRQAQALRAETGLSACTNAGPVVARRLPGGGVGYTREVVHRTSGHRAVVTDRFTPRNDSVRWDIEVRGRGAPWTTGIETRLHWPARKTTRFWTAWEDPEQKRDEWHDPLVLRPLVNHRLWYGAAPWHEEISGPGYQPTSGNGFVIPLLTIAEPESDVALSLVQSPQDTLLELSLSVRKSGWFVLQRNDHRFCETNGVRLSLGLVCNEADWRGGLRWMSRRYADFFNPPNARAHEIAGLGAYSDWEGELDAARLKRMGFRVNWKASYDFPYMGMFLPPVADTESYTRLVKSNSTSIRKLREYSTRMRQMGFHVLNYFNVTEFGATTGMPQEADPSLVAADRWRNVHNFMRDEVADGILLDLRGRRYNSWEGCVAMDCGGPHYRAFLLDQARRHIEKLPDSDGICIDRMDWLRFYNLHADDGQTWRAERACRSLYSSWRSLMAEVGPMFHAVNKVVFVNAMVNRTELLRHVDGIYHEFGHLPADLNGAALQCLFKPCIAWTPNESIIQPDPDAYFQRHLHLGVFPTAPLPHNDHTICAGTAADRWYLDYGPLFDTLRGKRWVLAPRCVDATTTDAKVNLFAVNGGYALPVTFGGTNQVVSVRVRNIAGLDAVEAKVWHPGADKPEPLTCSLRQGELDLAIPLKRRCAVVQLLKQPAP